MAASIRRGASAAVAFALTLALAFAVLAAQPSAAFAEDAAGLAGSSAAGETGAAEDPAVAQAPKILEQPEDATAVVGADAAFEVSADSAETYQWQKLAQNGDPLDATAWAPLDGEGAPAANGARLDLADVEPADAGSYRALVVGAAGETASEPAELTVTTAEPPSVDAPAEPAGDAAAAGEPQPAAAAAAAAAESSGGLAVTQQPDAPSAAPGESVRLTAKAAGGTGKISVQWQRSATLSASTVPTRWTTSGLDRATSETFTFAVGEDPNQSNRWYRAVFSDEGGASVTTEPVRLTVLPKPAVATHPSGQTVDAGGTATFTARPQSSEGVSVQWQSTRRILENGEPDGDSWTDVAGAREEALRVIDVPLSAHGTFYRAVFTNDVGSVATEAAQLRLTERLDTGLEVTVTGESYGPTGTTPSSFTVTSANAVVAGEPIIIEGAGYLTPDGTQGSVANFLVDAAYSGDPNTLSTTREVIDPVTGRATTDKRSHAVVEAKADGTWRVEIPWPTTKNTDRDAEFFAENWSAGSQHTVRVLTGTLRSGDYQRGISVRFTVVDSAIADPVAPEMTEQPRDAAVASGESAEFTASASGAPAPSVQWQQRRGDAAWQDIPGAGFEALVVGPVTSEDSGTRYRAVFESSAGRVVSEAAELTVDAGDIDVVRDPESQEVELGEAARFEAGAEGEEVTTRWERSRDGTEWEVVRGADDPIYTIDAVREDDAEWRYRARFTNPGDREGVVTEAATLGVIPRENVREYCSQSYGPDGHSGARYCFTGPEKVVAGQDIVLRGTEGYLASDGKTGSVVNFFFDALYSGDPNTLYVTQAVKNPATGKRVDDLRSHAVVQAGSDGAWTVTIPWPEVSALSKSSDGKQRFTQAELDERFAPGTRHAIRMLSGSLLSSPVDLQRGASLFFTVVESLDDPSAPVSAPIYEYQEYVSGAAGDGAIAWVPSGVDSGADFPLTGTGWLTEDGEAGSTVLVRLTDEDGEPYRHAGTAADPLAAANDDTVWQVVHVREDGELDTRVELPESVRSGSSVSVRLTTVSDGTASGDRDRDWTSAPLTVDGVPYTPPVSEGCTAAASEATFEIEPGQKVPAANVGGTIRVTGEHWCNLVGGGSLIALKINDGAYSHKGSASARIYDAEAGRETGLCEARICKTNKTIWYVIEADDQGTFDVEVPIPTRTDTTPAFAEGSYTFRVMTRTLSADDYYAGTRPDPSRTMQSEEFTVVCETCDTGAAKPGEPSQIPDPLHVTQDLTDAKRGGVTLWQREFDWVVTVPNGEPGDWVYINLYDGSTPRSPWGAKWYQLDGSRRAILPLDGVSLPAGTNKLSVQNRSGGLLGWTTATVEAASPEPAAGGAVGSTTASFLSGARFAPSASASRPKPATTPDAPVDHYDDLVASNSGGLTVTKEGDRLTVAFPDADGGDWVFLFLYTEAGRIVPVGWVQVGTDREVVLEVGVLPEGLNKLAFVGEDGKLIGWAGVEGDAAEDAASDSAPRSGTVPGQSRPAILDVLTGRSGQWTLILSGAALLVLAGSAVGIILLRTPNSGRTAAPAPAAGAERK